VRCFVCSVVVSAGLSFFLLGYVSGASGGRSVELRFTTREDFTQGTIGWNVRWTGDGIALNRAVSLIKHPVISIARTIYCVLQDTLTGELYLGSGDGLTVILPDGRSFTYRKDGLWDTTEDPLGELVDPSIKIAPSTSWIWSLWKDMKKGDIYIGTNDGGLNIIHTQGTLDPYDDTVEIYSIDTTPAILTGDPEDPWVDEEGNIYMGFHKYPGVTVIHPDGTSISYTYRGVLNTTSVSSSGQPLVDVASLISSTPRIGTGYKGWAVPLFKDEEGNLYVGTDRGLTVLYYNPDLGRYDRSVTYRSTGIWDTTEDPEGTLISSSPQIFTKDGFCILHPDSTVTVYTLDYTFADWVKETPWFEVYQQWSLTRPKEAVFYVWRDKDGALYLGGARKDEKGDIYYGNTVIHPDGTVTLYEFSSDIAPFRAPKHVRIIKGWKDSEGNYYTVTKVDTIMPHLGSIWRYSKGALYISTSCDVLVIGSFDGRSIRGSLTSGVIDVRRTPVRSIAWRGKTPPGSHITVQTRVGTREAVWVDEFEDGKVEGVSGVKGAEIKEEGGKLVVEGVPERSYLFFETGKPTDYFPRGCIVRAKVRGIGISRSSMSFVSLYTRGIYYDDYYPSADLEEGKWRTLMFRVIRKPFNRLAFELPQCERFEIDYISIEMPQGWTEWKEVTDPEGSPIPDLDEEHPYLQWRVLFSSDDINSLPVLKEVKLLPGPSTVEEEVSSVPRETLLHQNYPNPFNTQTVIRYQLSEGGYVRLAVYDVVGHRVRVLEEGEFPAGYYRVVCGMGRTKEVRK